MRKACRRKKVDPNTGLAAAIFGAGLLLPKQLAELRLKELSAIESLTKGKATEWDLREVESMISISSQMACSGVGPEAQAACLIAADHLRADLARMREAGAVSTTPEALQAYRDVFE
ncbi:MAG TPA: hypothetical protein VFH35_06755, partial [Ramlibacter sp.]|nr:hypothetical protein [Ramlibacter sp.]